MGPDVWEIVVALREVDERGEAAILATAELLALSPTRVRTALRYYSIFPDEIDAEIAQAHAASIAAERAWRSEQQLLA